MPASGDLIAYVRSYAERRLLVVLNLGPHPQAYELADLGGRALISTHLDRAGDPIRGRLALRGDEGIIVELV